MHGSDMYKLWFSSQMSVVVNTTVRDGLRINAKGDFTCLTCESLSPSLLLEIPCAWLEKHRGKARYSVK